MKVFNTFVDSFEVLFDIAAKERKVIEHEWHEEDLWHVIRKKKFNIIFIEKGGLNE